MATMFVASGSERTLADHLLPLLSSPPSIVHTSHAKEKGPSCMISHESKMDVLLLNQAVSIYLSIYNSDEPFGAHSTRPRIAKIMT